jgi:hypothetical protein
VVDGVDFIYEKGGVSAGIAKEWIAARLSPLRSPCMK